MRTTFGTILVVLGCLLAAPAVAAYALVGQVTDEQTYLEAVTPLADDPAIQQAVAGQIDASVAGKVPESAQPLLRQYVDDFVVSPEFKELWVTVNKEVHPQVLALLRGDDSGGLTVRGDAVMLDLGDVSALLRDRLTAEGVPFADQVPSVNASVQLISQPAVRDIQPTFELLETASVWLPIVAIVLLLGGILLSARHGRTMVVGGIGLIVMMLLLVLLLFLARSEATARSGQPELAGAFYDALTNQVMIIAWIVCGIGGVAVIVGGFLAAAQSRRAAAAARPRRTASASRGYGNYGDYGR